MSSLGLCLFFPESPIDLPVFKCLNFPESSPLVFPMAVDGHVISVPRHPCICIFPVVYKCCDPCHGSQHPQTQCMNFVTVGDENHISFHASMFCGWSERGLNIENQDKDQWTNKESSSSAERPGHERLHAWPVDARLWKSSLETGRGCGVPPPPRLGTEASWSRGLGPGCSGLSADSLPGNCLREGVGTGQHVISSPMVAFDVGLL